MDARRGQKEAMKPSSPMKGGVGITQGVAAASKPNNPAVGTAKYLQSFDEIAIRTEQPATTDGYVVRGNPRRDALLDDLPAVPQRLQAYDERQNPRADPQTFFRDTPQSAKDQQDKRPDWLYRFRQQAGEDIG